PAARPAPAPKPVKAPKPVPPRLTVRVSTTTPRRAKGFWVTVVVPKEAKAANARPRIRFQDARGKSYHLTLARSKRAGEWTRCFALEKAGRWRGIAILQAGKRKLVAPIPPF